MAIQVRRGNYADFDPQKMVTGEPAAVLANDPSVPSGKTFYVCYAPGDVKRLVSIEDLEEMLADGKFKGDKGDTGTSITDVDIDKRGHLMVTLSDGSSVDAGYIDDALAKIEEAKQAAADAAESQKQASQSAVEAENNATAAGASAKEAEQSNQESQAAKNEAQASATAAGESQKAAFESEKNSAESEESTRQYAEAADKSQQDAAASAKSAGQDAAEALQSKTEAADSASAAEKSKEAIENLGVIANTLPAGSDATVTKSVADIGVTLYFGIPRGEQGAVGPQGAQGIEGPEGKQGPPGESGITTLTPGWFTVSVDDDGNLWAYYADTETEPPLEYETETGNLYYTVPDGLD